MGQHGLIRGVVGFVKWSYYNAAELKGYTVSRKDDGTWRLSAVVVSADRFKMNQRPLIFAAPTEKGVWRWPITEADIANGRLRARMGEPLP